MKTTATIIGLLATLLVQTGAHAEGPGNSVVVEMAERFVTDNLELSAEARRSLVFGFAYVERQPEPTYWAVVGAFMGELSPSEFLPHNYIAGVRLLCADYQDADCWRLDKLAVDDRILFDIDKSGAAKNGV